MLVGNRVSMRYILFCSAFVALRQGDRNIFGRNDSMAMGRFFDIIISMGCV